MNLYILQTKHLTLNRCEVFTNKKLARKELMSAIKEFMHCNYYSCDVKLSKVGNDNYIVACVDDFTVFSEFRITTVTMNNIRRKRL